MTEITIDQIKPNTEQPRKHFDEVALQELADSIQEVGLLNPILVRPNGSGYEIVHGERRWRACQLAGLEAIRADVRELDDEAAFLIAFTENLQRDDLNAMEEAQALQALKDKFDFSQADIGAKIGKSQPWISGRLALLKLPEPVQEKVITRVITPSAARELSRIENAEIQADLADKAASGNLTVRELEAVKSAPVGDWPPPMFCPNHDSFQDVLEWAQQRAIYLDTNPRTSTPLVMTNLRKIIEMELCRAAGKYIDGLEQRYGKEICWLILKNGGKVYLAADHIVKTARGDLSKKELIIERFDLQGLFDKYPWAEDLLVKIGWIDESGALAKLAETNWYEFSMDNFDLLYILLWSHGHPVLYPSDPEPEGEKKPMADASLEPIPLKVKELTWANLVLEKYVEQGLKLTPRGIDGWPENMTFEEWNEGLIAIGIMCKYGNDWDLRKASANVTAPPDFAILVAQHEVQT